ncbi:MAG: hypothetical protein ABIR15_13520 [Chitinophagaceae bacterium]
MIASLIRPGGYADIPEKNLYSNVEIQYKQCGYKLTYTRDLEKINANKKENDIPVQKMKKEECSETFSNHTGLKASPHTVR